MVDDGPREWIWAARRNAEFYSRPGVAWQYHVVVEWESAPPSTARLNMDHLVPAATSSKTGRAG